MKKYIRNISLATTQIDTKWGGGKYNTKWKYCESDSTCTKEFEKDVYD